MGWLEDYLTYTERQESPTAFHLWSGIAVLGHVLGRRTWLNRFEAGKLYPGQIMVVLISGSAVTRKTTAMNLAARWLDYLPPSRVYVVPNMTSTERFIRGLDRLDPATSERLDAVGLILNDELGSFLSRSVYAETLLQHINQLNTNQKEIINIEFQSWQAELHNALVGMLACTTHSAFADELPASALKGGFMGRLIQVVEDEPRAPNPLTEPQPRQAELEAKLLRGLSRMVRLAGEFHFTPDGKTWFEEWYAKHFHHCWQNLTAEERETGWMGRKHDHVLRVGMVLSAAAGNSLTLSARHLQAALMFLETLQPKMAKTTQEVGTRENYSRVGLRILAVLEKRGREWARWKDVLANLHRYGDKDVIGRELQTLVEMELVERRDGKHGGTLYRRRYTRGEMLRAVDENATDGTASPPASPSPGDEQLPPPDRLVLVR